MGTQKSKIVNYLQSFKKDVKNPFGIEKIILFGSAARGEMHKNSDVDLILVSKSFTGKKFFKRGIGLYKYWKLPYPTDFLCYTPKEFERLKKRVSIVSEALKEGIAI